eukprot:CAMPEP_0201583960 /NCGR_PEP_ID=MMETSP0190_2-20130828/104991_1 /ASSEMBLY_ACC=CAM_ASM_000263 /TAXON_ID=37353 /ORGANISM="Rosalina sp." /LENGTH=70 /DNA_ID=CAMNT_0048026987 /DNA_START=52 /DNA_END=261 /DNA_ORIENTATION=-
MLYKFLIAATILVASNASQRKPASRILLNGVSNNRNSGYGNNDRNERSPYGGGVQFNEGGFDGYNGGGYR